MSLEKFKQLKEQVKQAKDEVNKVLVDTFAEITKIIFDKYPEVKSFGFTAYTDYFCDGDPCFYGVHNNDEQLYVNGKQCYDYDDEDEISEIATDISNMLQELDEDDYLNLFGDHVLVNVTRDGIVKEDYSDHD